MSKRSFSDAERKYLESLDAVESVDGDVISYAPEFRQSSMERYWRGDSPTEIFREAGLGPEVIGSKRIERAIARWRVDTPPMDMRHAPQRTVPEGVADLRRLRRENRALASRVRALEELLAYAGERPMEDVSRRERYELLERLRTENDDLAVTVACEALGISAGGYYQWRRTHGADCS